MCILDVFLPQIWKKTCYRNKITQTRKIDQWQKSQLFIFNKWFKQKHTKTAWYLYQRLGKQTNKKHLTFAQENNSTSLNSIKRLLAIIMIYKVTSQTDLQWQPERNPTQIQLLFTWLPLPTPSAHGRPRTGNTLVQTQTPSALNSPL